MRSGIISAGNWVIDHVKLIGCWPSQGMLSNVLDEYVSTGGAPANVLINLAKMEVPFPLYAGGVIGNDSGGDMVMRILKENGIDAKYMTRSEEKPTSYTDVMTEKTTGRRTFFHFRGANALLGVEHLEKMDADARIFHLGYLLLLDRLDSGDWEYGVAAARALDILQKKGYKTSVDVVSEESGLFRKIVLPCLKYCDYLILNEIEAGNSSGISLRDSRGRLLRKSLPEASEFLLERGIREAVVVHFPEGAYAADKSGKRAFIPSYEIHEEEIKGTVGAGDTFCAGFLYGMHEGIPLETALKMAHAGAYFNLLSPTSTGGAVPIRKLMDFIHDREA